MTPLRSISEVFICVIILSATGVFISCKTGDNKVKESNFEKQLGTYILDLDKTNLGVYLKDSSVYKKLQITFKADSTFIFNMKVPFIYDSAGVWEAGGHGVETWNYLRYKSNLKINTQFTRPWTSDSIFYMNSTTPQEEAESIQEIYFRKIYR